MFRWLPLEISKSSFYFWKKIDILNLLRIFGSTELMLWDKTLKQERVCGAFKPRKERTLIIFPSGMALAGMATWNWCSYKNARLMLLTFWTQWRHFNLTLLVVWQLGQLWGWFLGHALKYSAVCLPSANWDLWTLDLRFFVCLFKRGRALFRRLSMYAYYLFV